MASMEIILYGDNMESESLFMNVMVNLSGDCLDTVWRKHGKSYC